VVALAFGVLIALFWKSTVRLPLDAGHFLGVRLAAGRLSIALSREHVRPGIGAVIDARVSGAAKGTSEKVRLDPHCSRSHRGKMLRTRVTAPSVHVEPSLAERALFARITVGDLTVHPSSFH
jgi:hypothetical protein